MDRQDILLREYESCLQENNHLVNHYWTIFGILTSGSAVTIGILAAVSQFQLGSVSSLIGIIFIAIAGIVVLHYLRLYRRRIDFRISVNYERMREIEFDLGMWRSWRIRGIDDQKKRIDKDDKYKDEISANDRTILFAYRPESWWSDWAKSHHYQKPIGRRMADVIVYTLQSLWFLSAVIFVIQFIIAS